MLLTLFTLIVVCILCVVIHFEVLMHMSAFMAKHHTRPKRRILIGVFGAGFAHVVEALLFGLGLALIITLDDQSYLAGELQRPLLDHIYFSFTCYSTLGFGDLVPMGPIKLYAGCESLAGLILIAWSASFLYVQMEHHWRAS